MATITLHVADELRALGEARASNAGFTDLSKFLEQLIKCEATGAPAGLTCDCDEDLETIVSARIDGPFVPMDGADFQQMRSKLRTMLGDQP